MAAFEMMPAKVWTPQRKAFVVRNLLGAFNGATPQQRQLGARFYPDWNEDANFLADRAGVSPEHGAAMLARLSPTTEAEVNRLMGYQLASLTDRQTSRIHQAAEFAREATRHRAGTPERTALTAESKRLRGEAGLRGTPLNLQSSTAISEALRIHNGEYDDPLSTLGRVKIGDFGRTIHNPLNERQVIDTHYHDAMLGRTDIPYEADRGLGAVGRYENFQDAAGTAHRKAIEAGLITPDTAPNAFMGGIWYRQQQHKANSNPDARKARKASESRLGNFLKAAGSHAWDPAAVGMRPVANHIAY